MKTTIKLLGILAALMALSACAGGGGGGADVHTAPVKQAGNVSADAAGNCSDDYVSKYNDIVFEAKLLETQASMGSTPFVIIGQIQALDLACQRFFSKHNDVSCKAEIEGKTFAIKSSNAKPTCDKAKDLLKQFGQ